MALSKNEYFDLRLRQARDIFEPLLENIRDETNTERMTQMIDSMFEHLPQAVSIWNALFKADVMDRFITRNNAVSPSGTGHNTEESHRVESLRNVVSDSQLSSSHEVEKRPQRSNSIIDLDDAESSNDNIPSAVQENAQKVRKIASSTNREYDPEYYSGDSGQDIVVRDTMTPEASSPDVSDFSSKGDSEGAGCDVEHSSISELGNDDRRWSNECDKAEPVDEVVRCGRINMWFEKRQTRTVFAAKVMVRVELEVFKARPDNVVHEAEQFFCVQLVLAQLQNFIPEGRDDDIVFVLNTPQMREGILTVERPKAIVTFDRKWKTRDRIWRRKHFYDIKVVPRKKTYITLVPLRKFFFMIENMQHIFEKHH